MSTRYRYARALVIPPEGRSGIHIHSLRSNSCIVKAQSVNSSTAVLPITLVLITKVNLRTKWANSTFSGARERTAGGRRALYNEDSRPSWRSDPVDRNSGELIQK